MSTHHLADHDDVLLIILLMTILLMTIMLLYVGCNGKSGEGTNLGLTLLTSSGGRELPLH